MNHYTQTLLLAAKPATVFAALTTADGIHGWWTQDSDVEERVGGEIRLRFDRHHKEMRVELLEPGNEVRWLCTGAHIAREDFSRHDEWVGTTLIFRLSAGDRGCTRLVFEHRGLVPEFECYELCSKGWDYFLGSLQKYVETGCGTPYERAPAAIAA